MRIAGIICEYNPFHLGHKKQIDEIRRLWGEDTAVVCLMSGNFVQRGAPAILDKTLRARAALECGADLVLELPVEYALCSAEGFAAGGVAILGPFCDCLCFGAETPEPDVLLNISRTLLSEEFRPLLKAELEKGLCFPAARQSALSAAGVDASVLESPNNILAVEYCKAILAQGHAMQPLPIHRCGSYHAQTPDAHNPSATALRTLMLERKGWEAYMPDAAASCFTGAPLHTLQSGEQAILARLRTMTDAEFEALPYGSEGLWHKFQKSCREQATLEQIIAATKSKRYTRTRIDRMVMCAVLGLNKETLAEPAPYVRVLALNDRGRTVLKKARETSTFLNAGEVSPTAYAEREQRIGDLYGLFCSDGPEAPGTEKARRVCYRKTFL